MKKKILDFLICPTTKESLQLEIFESHEDEIINGLLKSSTCEYKITEGIPRFVQCDDYSSNFVWQWNKWPRLQFENENIENLMAGYTKNMFNKITEFTKEKINQKLVLDIGCGAGRFADIANSYGAAVVAIDHTLAIDVCKKNLLKNKSDVFFIQGDALNLPFKNDTFDYAFCIGVLHHTPKPLTGVNEAYRVLKKNSEFALSVYANKSYYDFITVKIWRKFFNFLRPVFGNSIPYLYAQIFGRINFYLYNISKYISFPTRFFFPSVILSDIKWSILDTFDSITPSYQSTHSLNEVYNWFKEVKFKEIRVTAWKNIIGKK